MRPACYTDHCLCSVGICVLRPAVFDLRCEMTHETYINSDVNNDRRSRAERTGVTVHPASAAPHTRPTEPRHISHRCRGPGHDDGAVAHLTRRRSGRSPNRGLGTVQSAASGQRLDDDTTQTRTQARTSQARHHIHPDETSHCAARSTLCGSLVCIPHNTSLPTNRPDRLARCALLPAAPQAATTAS